MMPGPDDRPAKRQRSFESFLDADARQQSQITKPQTFTNFRKGQNFIPSPPSTTKNGSPQPFDPSHRTTPLSFSPAFDSGLLYSPNSTEHSPSASLTSTKKPRFSQGNWHSAGHHTSPDPDVETSALRTSISMASKPTSSQNEYGQMSAASHARLNAELMQDEIDDPYARQILEEGHPTRAKFSATTHPLASKYKSATEYSGITDHVKYSEAYHKDADLRYALALQQEFDSGTSAHEQDTSMPGASKPHDDAKPSLSRYFDSLPATVDLLKLETSANGGTISLGDLICYQCTKHIFSAVDDLQTIVSSWLDGSAIDGCTVKCHGCGVAICAGCWGESGCTPQSTNHRLLDKVKGKLRSSTRRQSGQPAITVPEWCCEAAHPRTIWLLLVHFDMGHATRQAHAAAAKPLRTAMNRLPSGIGYDPDMGEGYYDDDDYDDYSDMDDAYIDDGSSEAALAAVAASKHLYAQDLQALGLPPSLPLLDSPKGSSKLQAGSNNMPIITAHEGEDRHIVQGSKMQPKAKTWDTKKIKKMPQHHSVLMPPYPTGGTSYSTPLAEVKKSVKAPNSPPSISSGLSAKYAHGPPSYNHLYGPPQSQPKPLPPMKVKPTHHPAYHSQPWYEEFPPLATAPTHATKAWVPPSNPYAGYVPRYPPPSSKYHQSSTESHTKIPHPYGHYSQPVKPAKKYPGPSHPSSLSQVSYADDWPALEAPASLKNGPHSLHKSSSYEHQQARNGSKDPHDTHQLGHSAPLHADNESYMAAKHLITVSEDAKAILTPGSGWFSGPPNPPQHHTWLDGYKTPPYQPQDSLDTSIFEHSPAHQSQLDAASASHFLPPIEPWLSGQEAYKAMSSVWGDQLPATYPPPPPQLPHLMSPMHSPSAHPISHHQVYAHTKASKAPKGIGYGGGGVGGLHDHYAPKRRGRADPQSDKQKLSFEEAVIKRDAFATQTFSLLSRLINSAQAMSLGREYADIMPPHLLASSILDVAAETLRHDSLEDAMNRKELYQAVFEFVSVLVKEKDTQGLVLNERPAKRGSRILHPSLPECEAENYVSSLQTSMSGLVKQCRAISRTASTNPREAMRDMIRNGLKDMFDICQVAVPLWDTLKTIKNTHGLEELLSSSDQSEVSKRQQWLDYQRDHAFEDVPDEVMFADHAYAKDAKAQTDVAKGRMKRLIEEGACLSTSLPPNILVRHAENRPDVMKALIIGPSGTPYDGGVFEFDFWATDRYPQVPPKCTFKTTGGGRAHFNPNLYECGKVCLSLLGTWSGERWRPGESTILQILVSLQSLVLNEEPWYNEPGREHGYSAQSEMSRQYNRDIQMLTLRFALDEALTKNAAHLKQNGCKKVWLDVVRRYFEGNSEELGATMTKWMNDNPRLNADKVAEKYLEKLGQSEVN